MSTPICPEHRAVNNFKAFYDADDRQRPKVRKGITT
jgi:hypothetical protein